MKNNSLPCENAKKVYENRGEGEGTTPFLPGSERVTREINENEIRSDISDVSEILASNRKSLKYRVSPSRDVTSVRN